MSIKIVSAGVQRARQTAARSLADLAGRLEPRSHRRRRRPKLGARPSPAGRRASPADRRLRAQARGRRAALIVFQSGQLEASQANESAAPFDPRSLAASGACCCGLLLLLLLLPALRSLRLSSSSLLFAC
jgi:hypothetical protein